MTSLTYSFILLVIALEVADVETPRCRVPGACPPLPETCPALPNMLAFDLPGVPGVGRRVPAHKLNAVPCSPFFGLTT